MIKTTRTRVSLISDIRDRRRHRSVPILCPKTEYCTVTFIHPEGPLEFTFLLGSSKEKRRLTLHLDYRPRNRRDNLVFHLRYMTPSVPFHCLPRTLRLLKHLDGWEETRRVYTLKTYTVSLFESRKYSLTIESKSL